MEKIVKALRISSRLQQVLCQRHFSTSRHVAAYWNKDWKPGPYPKTPEERAAAAKKYGLKPEDYDVYPDDGTGFGDYPKLPMISGDARDLYENYDIPQQKRNWGEPLHVHADMLGEDRLDLTTRRRYSELQMFSMFAGVVGGIVLIYYLMEPYPYFHPFMRKQFPYNELYLDKGGEPANELRIKHYTFEPAD